MRVHPDIYPTILSGFLTYDGVTMPQSHEWPDTHVPRTERPVRFCYLSNAPESRPCIARGYMGYARPVRFA